MIFLTTTLMPSSSLLLSINAPTFSFSSLSKLKPNIKLYQQRRKRNGLCRAEFSLDAPFMVAIGACMVSSLILPVASAADDEDEEGGGSAIVSTDVRFAAMGIISFIPYFNWLSWVFAWMDTRENRYAVYALVYLAPYVRSNLSLSPEESWLPIASILFCIAHIQLEASIINRDIQGFQFFSKLQSGNKHAHEDGRESILEKGKTIDDMKLPSAQEHSEDES